MESPMEIATTAANAIVGAMATGAWTYVSGRCTELFAKYLPDKSDDVLFRLDSYERLVARADPAARDEARREVAAVTARELAALAGHSETAAASVRALGEEAAGHPDGSVAIQRLTFNNIKAGGDFYGSGGDINIRKEK